MKHLALVLGANVGSCITSGLACLGKPRRAKRVALCHFLFRAVGVLMFAPFLPLFEASLSLSSLRISQQIANAHTVFNLALVLLVVYLWLCVLTCFPVLIH